MVIVNLKHIADIPDRICTREELRVVLDTAEEILATTPEDVIVEIMQDWETALVYGSDAASEEWYWRALLLTCCRGLLGIHRPKFVCFYRDI